MDAPPSPTDEQTRDRRFARNLILAALVLAALGGAALSIDVEVARWFDPELRNCPKVFVKLFTISEAFAHGIGIAIWFAVIYALDPLHRREMFRLAAIVLGAGGVTDILKISVARTRPQSWDFSGVVFDTFGPWFPGLTEQGRAIQSFPSGHTTVAAALAVGLVWRYPRGKFLFPTLAFFSGMQRVQAQAHYPSDVLWGAAVACLAGAVCIHPDVFGKTFRRLESKG